MKYVRTDLYMRLHTELGRLWVTPTIVFNVFNWEIKARGRKRTGGHVYSDAERRQLRKYGCKTRVGRLPE